MPPWAEMTKTSTKIYINIPFWVFRVTKNYFQAIQVTKILLQIYKYNFESGLYMQITPTTCVLDQLKIFQCKKARVLASHVN